jgi:Glycoside hydrolase 97.
MEELMEYAKQKNVGVILWVVWKSLDDQLIPALDQYARWGVSGIKVDFMQRNDQLLMNYYYKVSRECAKRKNASGFSRRTTTRIADAHVAESNQHGGSARNGVEQVER